jgi:hypothetical protein
VVLPSSVTWLVIACSAVSPPRRSLRRQHCGLMQHRDVTPISGAALERARRAGQILRVPRPVARERHRCRRTAARGRRGLDIPSSLTARTRNDPARADGLGGDFYRGSSTGRGRDRLTGFTQAFDVKGDRILHLSRALVDSGTGSHDTCEVRAVGGVVGRPRSRSGNCSCLPSLRRLVSPTSVALEPSLPQDAG